MEEGGRETEREGQEQGMYIRACSRGLVACECLCTDARDVRLDAAMSVMHDTRHTAMCVCVYVCTCRHIRNFNAQRIDR